MRIGVVHILLPFLHVFYTLLELWAFAGNEMMTTSLAALDYRAEAAGTNTNTKTFIKPISYQRLLGRDSGRERDLHYL